MRFNIPECPICRNRAKVMGLPGFIKAGGNMTVFATNESSLEEVASLQLGEFAVILDKLPMPDRPEGIVGWTEAFDLWYKAFVCGDRHQGSNESVPRGMVVFYNEGGKTHIMSPVEFAKKLKEVAGLEE